MGTYDAIQFRVVIYYNETKTNFSKSNCYCYYYVFCTYSIFACFIVSFREGPMLWRTCCFHTTEISHLLHRINFLWRK